MPTINPLAVADERGFLHATRGRVRDDTASGEHRATRRPSRGAHSSADFVAQHVQVHRIEEKSHVIVTMPIQIRRTPLDRTNYINAFSSMYSA